MKIQIDATALQHIASTIRSSDPLLETGGALFGPQDGSKVLHAAGPGSMAEHGTRFFRRDLAYTEQEAERLYQADGSQWIGEWHTHVDAPPTPSDLDLHTYLGHIADRDLGFDRFVALIVATSRPEPILATWLLERQRFTIVLIQAGQQRLSLSN
jgi:integrative and conjugative element protein (TIGR02256 family)